MSPVVKRLACWLRIKSLLWIVQGVYFYNEHDRETRPGRFHGPTRKNLNISQNRTKKKNPPMHISNKNPKTSL